MQQCTTWSFSVPRADIDLARIFAEAPASCRVLKITVDGGRLLAIRIAAHSAAEAAGLTLPGRWTGWIPAISAGKGFATNRTTAAPGGWLVCRCFGSDVDLAAADVLAVLAAADAHAAAHVDVIVRAW
jgi:hypothetical protein